MATAGTRAASIGSDQLLSLSTSADVNPIAKLIQHNANEVDKVKQKLKQLTKFTEDYEVLKERLETLPDRISHQVMVPIGKMAFLPGRIKHTNEVLCLLGDDWFVERSAKQAAQIVERRLKDCRHRIQQFQEELKLIEKWTTKTREFQEELKLNEGVNITEVEEDDGWREEHRKKVKEYKQKMAEMKRLEAESQNKGGSSTEEDLWRRLDELELMEELQDELDLLGLEDDGGEASSQEEEEEEEANEDEPSPVGANADQDVNTAEAPSRKKSVRWSQSPDAIKQFRRDELIAPRPTTSQCDDDNDKGQDTMKITFKHSPGSKKKKTARFSSDSGGSDDSRDPSSTAAVVSNPSDIFRKFVSLSPTVAEERLPAEAVAGPSRSNEPKSILKVKKSTTPVMEMVQPRSQVADRPDVASATPPAPDPPQQQQTTSAVGDEVKERGETVAQSDANVEESVNTHRPVSRFRAARMNKKIS